VSVPDSLRVDEKATAVLAVCPPLEGSGAHETCDDGGGDVVVEVSDDDPTGAAGPTPDKVKLIVEACPLR
jgi:hypothetical protein